MIRTPAIDWLTLAPSLALLAATIAALMSAVLVPERWRKNVSWAFCLAGLRGRLRGGGSSLRAER